MSKFVDLERRDRRVMETENKMPDPVRFLIEDLIRTAKEHHITVAGFAFSAEPLCFTNFGNCSDMAKIKLYELLCEMAEEKRARGQVIQEFVGEVN